MCTEPHSMVSEINWRIPMKLKGKLIRHVLEMSAAGKRMSMNVDTMVSNIGSLRDGPAISFCVLKVPDMIFNPLISSNIVAGIANGP